MNSIDRQYKELLEHILHFGVDKQDRTGTGTKSIFGWQIRHNMKEGFPLLTTKKMAWKTMVTELLWFLRGDTNIQYLVKNGCHIWDGDAYKKYKTEIEKSIDDNAEFEDREDFKKFLVMSKEDFIDEIKTDDEFAKKWGELGPIYGKQWRSWTKLWWEESELSIASGGVQGGTYYKPKQIDQIANLISELKTNPDSRRLMVSAWNYSDLEAMVLPPCHYGFQVYTRELNHKERFEYYTRNSNTGLSEINFTPPQLDELNVPKRAISLMYNTRSQDVPLGTPFNIASYALLLMMIAKQVNMIPDELITNMGDCHIYLNQIDGVKEQMNRTPFELPTVELLGYVDDIANYKIEDIVLKGYQSHPSIKIPLSN
jgi:thymidylate synthase